MKKTFKFLSVAIFVIAVFLYIGETNKTFAYIWGAVAIIGIIAAFVGFRFSGVHHEVLINDDVPFVEFHEKYEVVDERGEIFVIEERK